MVSTEARAPSADGESRRPPVRRSLFAHAPIRREPRAAVRRLADAVESLGGDAGPAPVAALERRMAGLLGADAALLFPGGTMAQQVALRVHAERRGRRGFAGHPQCNLDVWEMQGYNAVHNLWFHPVGDRHELMTGADLAAVGEPLAAVVWELPQRDLGGLLPDWDDLREQVAVARAGGAAAHVDGARLFEARLHYGRPIEEIAGLFDTVYVSLYKGLEGIGGAVLAGDGATIAEAAVWRHRLGGAIADPWPDAVTALAGLDSHLPLLPAFRDHAIAMAAAVNADGVALAHPDPPQTSLFHVHLPAPKRAVERAGAAMIAERGVQLFPRVRSSPDPTRCSFEVSVADNAMDFTPDEVVGLLHELLDRAAALR
ncbi:threonine aldolase family protein [Actinomadura roseirufa]|uniref:threonine aldolase family protein n=1 Tax=Actinomadura roseirufa TaxID=2094049 RepID=UPI0010416D45|nr:beta-eliminating lyase-related protein [Actinomadura roseirufa]